MNAENIGPKMTHNAGLEQTRHYGGKLMVQKLCDCGYHKSYNFWRTCCGDAGIKEGDEDTNPPVPQVGSKDLLYSSIVKKLMMIAFVQGYEAGHDDTVESGYTDAESRGLGMKGNFKMQLTDFTLRMRSDADKFLKMWKEKSVENPDAYPMELREEEWREYFLEHMFDMVVYDT